MIQYDATRRIGTYMRALVLDFAKINFLLLYKLLSAMMKKKYWCFRSFSCFTDGFL